MAENRRESKTLKLKAISKEVKRSVYSFENPDNPAYDLKYSAFNPAPDLEIGKWYEMTIEHVPTGKNDGSEYHNIARTMRDGPFIIKEASPCLSAPMGKPDSKDQPMTKDEYWERKEKVEIIKHNQIRREAVLNASIEYAKIQCQVSSEILSTEKLLELADKFDNYVINGHKKEATNGPAK